MTEFTIIRDREDEIGIDDNGNQIIYHNDEYRVHSLSTKDKEPFPAAAFIGTYTQCLIYVGAIAMGKQHKVARNFALGVYR